MKFIRCQIGEFYDVKVDRDTWKPFCVCWIRVFFSDSNGFPILL
ncbi:hypothetical protein S1OALGB6SA_1014 [Olavius algarvensis spirochete endosymbiont]|nr:hypothetical protein S1OALGB6SA_1014 [Olavius algarvensis spirochete endosymbiont]